MVVDLMLRNKNLSFLVVSEVKMDFEDLNWLDIVKYDMSVDKEIVEFFYINIWMDFCFFCLY